MTQEEYNLFALSFVNRHAFVAELDLFLMPDIIVNVFLLIKANCLLWYAWYSLFVHWFYIVVVSFEYFIYFGYLLTYRNGFDIFISSHNSNKSVIEIEKRKFYNYRLLDIMRIWLWLSEKRKEFMCGTVVNMFLVRKMNIYIFMEWCMDQLRDLKTAVRTYFNIFFFPINLCSSQLTHSVVSYR